MLETSPGVEFRIYLDKFNKDMEEIKTKISGIGTVADKESQKIDKISRKLGGALSVGAAIAAAKQAISAIIDIRSEFEKYSAVLTNTLGSQEAANQAMQDLQVFSAKTPFQLNELTGAYVKLVNQGFKPTMGEMTKLGDLASSVGKSFDQLAEGIIDAQTGEFERLKEFGIKAQKEGDNVIFTFKGVKTQVENSNEAIRNYILSLGELQGVSGSMAAISQSLGGAISNLNDSWDMFLNNLGAKTSGVMKGVITMLGNLLNKMNESMKNSEKILSTTKIEEFENIQKRVTGTVEKETGSLDALFVQLKNTNQGSEARNEIMGKINSQYGQYLPFLLTEKTTIEQITQAQHDANVALMQTIALKTQQDEVAAVSAQQQKREIIVFEELAKQYGVSMRMVKAVFDEYYKVNESEATLFNQAAVTGKVMGITLIDLSEKFNEFVNVTGANPKVLRESLKNLKDLKQQTKAQIDAIMELYDGYIDYITKPSPTGPVTFDPKLMTEELARIKKLYEEYEKIKGLQGEEAVKDTYNSLLQQGQNYGEYLQNLLEKYKSNLEARKMILLEFLEFENKNQNKVQKVASGIAPQEDDTEYQRLLDKTANFEQKLAKIWLDFYLERKALMLNGENERVRILEIQFKNEVGAIKETQGYYDWLYASIDDLSRQELRNYIKRIEIELNKSEISCQERINLEKALARANEELSKKLINNFNDVATILGKLSLLADEFNEELSKTIEHAANLATAASDIAAGFSTGNYALATSGILQALTEIAKIYKGDEKEAANNYIIEKSYQRINNQLEKQLKLIQDISGKENWTEQRELAELYVKSIEKINKDLIKLFKERGTDLAQRLKDSGLSTKQITQAFKDRQAAFDAYKQGDINQAIALLKNYSDNDPVTKALVEELENLEEKKEQQLKDFNKSLTATTGDAITNSILDGLRAGERGAEAFADTFENLMKEAVLNSFKMQMIQPFVDEWYQQFSDAMESDGALTPDEITALQAAFNANIIAISDSADQMLNSLGLLNNKPKTNSTAGAIEQIQENTANILAGHIGNIRINVADQVRIMTNQFDKLNQIEVNTRKLDGIYLKLDSIDYTLKNGRAYGD